MAQKLTRKQIGEALYVGQKWKHKGSGRTVTVISLDQYWAVICGDTARGTRQWTIDRVTVPANYTEVNQAEAGPKSQPTDLVVIIEGEGMVIHSLTIPAGVTIRIYDYDVDSVDEGRIVKDAHGIDCTISVVTGPTGMDPVGGATAN
jgi:hypothetical protein